MLHVYASFEKRERGVTSSTYIRVSVHRMRPCLRAPLCAPVGRSTFPFYQTWQCWICPLASSAYIRISVHRLRCLQLTCSLCPAFWLYIKRSGCPSASAGFCSLGSLMLRMLQPLYQTKHLCFDSQALMSAAPHDLSSVSDETPSPSLSDRSFRLHRIFLTFVSNETLSSPVNRSHLHAASLFPCTALPATCVALEQVQLLHSEIQ